jgi:hypothetical protein
MYVRFVFVRFIKSAIFSTILIVFVKIVTLLLLNPLKKVKISIAYTEELFFFIKYLEKYWIRSDIIF